MNVRNNTKSKTAAKVAKKKISKVTRPSSVSKKTKSDKKIKPFAKKPRRGVVYLSHIPHGFYENQIKAYFAQFGEVTGVNVPRSKAGRARGFAFVEFKHPDVAKIAAETMDNYLMHNRLMKAKYLEPKEQKPYVFEHIGSEDYKSVKEKSMENVEANRNHKNSTLSEVKENNKITKFKVKKLKRDKELNEMGISYKYDLRLN